MLAGPHRHWLGVPAGARGGTCPMSLARWAGGALHAGGSGPDNSLWEAIAHRYQQAQGSGAARSTPTRVQYLRDGSPGVEFILQVASALQRKPKSREVSQGSAAPRNPFLPYEEALWVRHLSPTHSLLLNKFDVVPRHTLVVTRRFEPQDAPLTLEDFQATWDVLRSAPDPGALAFFNSGGAAGASQPHRHVQIVPLPLAPGSASPGPPLSASVLHGCAAAPGVVCALRALPFASWAVRLGESAEADEVHLAYRALAAAGGVFDGAGAPTQDYNLLLTAQYLHLVPRRQERVGPLSCNALCFAGTFFVKDEEQLRLVHDTGPFNILAAVGQAWD